MVDQMDARQNSEEEDGSWYVNANKPQKIGLDWSEKDEEIRLAYEKRIENSQKPSIWEYNPKGGMPTELANVNLSTFLTSHLGQILCFLPKDVLVRICAMLSVCDFINLSLTCRFLHWRMFTFCTCYTPYTVGMRVDDSSWKGKKIPPKWIYSLYDGVIDEDPDPNGFHFAFDDGSKEATITWQYPPELDGLRGLFVYQPFCLRRPFIFDTLRLQITFPFYYKQFYDRCLPYIMAVRDSARHLDITFYNFYNGPENTFISFPDTNEFFTATNASYYNNMEVIANRQIKWNNMDIYMNCPYARQMYRVYIGGNTINVPFIQNSVGIFVYTADNTIIATLKNFLTGSTNLILHEYTRIEENNGRFRLIEYLFQEFGEFDEFIYTKGGFFYYYIWKKVVATENGGLLRIVIRMSRDEYGSDACLLIGKEEMFDEIHDKYISPPENDGIWWKMETAVEPDEDEKSDEDEELEETEES